jgi:two-component system LytT family response regulator
MKAFVVDDEPIAIDRLRHLLGEHPHVAVVGSQSDPSAAIAAIRTAQPDVLFLDIEMPGLSGFDLLEKLDAPQPLTVFTTAYEQYALEAFKVNSIDYLLKPIEADHLKRALDKAERMLRQGERPIEMRALLAQIGTSLQFGKSPWLDRIASRIGDKVEPIDLRRVTHFFSMDKLTYAATIERSYVVDNTIADLETKLNPVQFIRIHRSTILNLDHLQELHALFGGCMVARLKDGKKTELAVSRNRVGALKSRLGL